jgi:TonB family protein
MKLPRSLACLALIALAIEAPAEVRAEVAAAAQAGALAAATPAEHHPLPRIPAEPETVPASLLELLPPGARPPALRAAVSERNRSYGARSVERISSPLLTGNGSRWLEIEYTVDPELDERVRRVLEGARVSLAHVILMDPVTGEVFSYVSTDPESFPATRPYPAASLMKVVTAAALLRNAPEAANRDCRYVGSPWELNARQLEPPPSGGRVSSFRRAIAISNNQCFARYAVSDVGREALLEEIQRVGFLDTPGAGHAPGRILPVRSRLSLGQLGSGVAGSFITPLSAVRLAAALAEGELVHPFWIARVDDSEGNPLILPGRPDPQPEWSPDFAAELREMLVGVTERGTARRAFHERSGDSRLGSIRVSGKTGTVTGDDPPGRYQWFIGVAPAEEPRIAIAAVVVNDSGPGNGAARIAANALAEVFCAAGRCDPLRVERLHARAEQREAEREAEILAAREERERMLAFKRARRTAAAHRVVDLDRPPRPIAVTGFDFPRRLLRNPVDGEIVLLLEISEEGEVLDVEIASSNLPDFSEFVSRAVRRWRFTPPTQDGLPVKTTARLPIPIHIN